MFPILWTLDPLSLGFNFCPPAQERCSLPCLLMRLSLRGSSHVIRSRPASTYSGTTHATMLPRPRCGTRRCTMRQQSGAAPLSAGSPRLFTIISSLSLSFPFFYSVPIEHSLQWCRRIRTDSPISLSFSLTRDLSVVRNNDCAIDTMIGTKKCDNSREMRRKIN